MNANKKFVSKYLSFCKRLAKFTEMKKELDAEIEGMNALVDEPEVVNFSKRGLAKLRKFSEALKEATNQVEELQDSTEDLAVAAEKTDFSKVPAKVRILKREFASLEADLNKINEDVKDVIEESATDGEVTSHETASPGTAPTEQPANESGVTESSAATPPAEGVVEGDAELNKKASAVNFSKKDFLKSKIKNFCNLYKNFSDELENSGDIIEDITDEVTIDEAPTATEVTPTETPAEETPTETPAEETASEVANFDQAVELAEGIADDIAEDSFDEESAASEIETKEFSAKTKELTKKLIKAFGRVKKHFDEKLDNIKKDLDSTPKVEKSELTTEEAKTLDSEFLCFSKNNKKNFSKRLEKKFAKFSEVCNKFGAEDGTTTEEVVDAAADVADVIDTTENAPAEFKEFSKKVRKFIKMFSDIEKVTEGDTEDVAITASPEVIEKDSQMNSTLDTVNGKIEKLDLPADVTNFAKLSSKSLSKMKCFSEGDVETKLQLIEEFCDSIKKFCDKKNFGEGEVCPKCGKNPCECPPAETPAPAEETPVETPAPTEETPAPTEETPAETPAEETPVETETVEVSDQEFSDDEDLEETEEVEDTPAEEPVAQVTEETPAPVEETPAETPAEETPAETPAEENTPPDSEVVLKNFSATQSGNKNYGMTMARLAFMN